MPIFEAFRASCLACLGALVLVVPSAAADSLKLTHQGVERTAVLLRPAAGADGPMPLIVALHGLGGSGENFSKWQLFEPLAEQERFITLYPSAIEGQWSYGRPVVRPMPMVGGETVDDLGFLRLLTDDLIGQKVADPARIYVMGVSRGGLMAFTVACALGDRVAAVAVLITPMTLYQRDGCKPARPVPIMLIAGTQDQSQPYDGANWPLGRLMSIPETMDFWRQQHGCAQRNGRMLPHIDPTDRTQVMLIEWGSCRSGVSPLLYRVVGGGHQVPSIRAGANPMSEERFGLRNRDIEAGDVIWAYFKRFTL
jgi:polyhydroxybutyrate depolymerase